MRVFVYEFFSGGGARELAGGESKASLLKEAAAMARAVTEDFAAVSSVRVVTTRDRRLQPFHPAGCEVIGLDPGGGDFESLARLARDSDWTLLIAPETGGELLSRVQTVEQLGGRLLSPGSDFIRIAGNKQLTAEALHCAGIRVPRGMVWSNGQRANAISFPAVIKPIDGCGSQDVRRLNGDEYLADLNSGRWRIEEYVAGKPASVSVLCGPKKNWPLTVCEQRLSDDGHFSYVGGRLPLAPKLDRRARQLALCAVEALGPATGYVGVDLVLGGAADGSDDYVIEVNPRLTTSYVGLRAASRTNLAAAMLAVAYGDEPVLSFGGEPIEFTAAGEILQKFVPQRVTDG